jgi:PAS domain S-box-containing protein
MNSAVEKSSRADLRAPQHVVVFTADGRGHWLAIDGDWYEVTGQDKADAQGAGWFARLAPGAREMAEASFSAAITGAPQSVRLGVLDATSRSRGALLSIFPSSDRKAPLNGALVIDASSGSFAAAPESLTSMVQNLPDAVARIDATGRYLYINRAAEQVYGLAAPAIAGRLLDEIDIGAGFSKALRHCFDQVLAKSTPCEFQFAVSRAERGLHFSARLLPELDGEARLSSVLLVASDITAHTEAQLERDTLLIREQASRMQAEAAARARDEFLAIVSHELRSPLNGIQSWTHVLEAYVPMEQPLVVRALAGIKLGVQQQVRLIEDLLDATLIMSGKLRLSKSVVSLEDSVDAALASVAASAAEKGVTLTKEPRDKIPPVEADGKRIEQVVWNLLSNAIKFTPEGGEVRVSIEGRDEEVLITVRDNGRGISPQFIPYLFDPFRQADESSTRRAGGIGLGLTLVRRLTELHGGRVVAESAGENLGSVFSVLLPLDLSAGALVEPTVKRHGEETLASLQGIKVALVDDLEEARDSLAELLEQAGAKVKSFSSGKAVVAELRIMEAADRPDVLICDIAMPEQDGYRTLQQIREDESTRALMQMPAVALTAFSQREDELKALASGFQVHMAKPVEPSEIISILAALAAREQRVDGRS